VVAGVSLLEKSPDVAYTILGASSVLILGNAFMIRSHFVYGSRGVANITVLPSGLRWVKSSAEPARSAAWSEIAQFELNHTSPCPWRHFLTITFRSGEVLALADFSLTDYHSFAKLVHDSYRQGGATRLFAPAARAY
jgi:hypothetical protein